MASVDHNAMAASYDAGRAVSLAALEPWRSALEPYLSAERVVFDLGSGTGIFAEAFARWFGVRVVGVEPSAGMRARAVHERTHPLVLYVGGTAERLPLKRGAGRVAWLSTVIHHFSDLQGCAREVGHVLGPDGVVLIRSAFADRLDRIRLFRYFPEARKVAETFPTVRTTIDSFAAVGFARLALHRVAQESAPSLRDYAARVRTRADSTLAAITDAEFSAGLRRLDFDAAREYEPSPVVDGLDLLVLTQRG